MQIWICPIHLKLEHRTSTRIKHSLGANRRQPSKLQFQLFDLASNPLAHYSEDHAPKLGDDQLQVLELPVAGSGRFVVGRGVETGARQRRSYSDQEASPRKGFTKLNHA
jgi:hypothetical protein